MFSKKIIFYTNEKEDKLPLYTKEELKNCFLQIPKNLPSYFKSIPKSFFHTEYNKFLLSLHTIKTCPGFINLFKRSILCVSPVDMQFIFDDTNVKYSGCGNKIMPDIVSIHPGMQFLDYVPKTDIKFIMKLSINLNVDSNVALLFHNPWYFFSEYETLAGITPSNYKTELNFFIPIKKEMKELIIRIGDPLFFITPLTEKKIKLKFEIRNHGRQSTNTFSHLHKFIMEKLCL